MSYIVDGKGMTFLLVEDYSPLTLKEVRGSMPPQKPKKRQ